MGGKVRLMLSGGAPLSPDTHEQIKLCLCVDVIQGYGLTETTSGATVMDGKLNWKIELTSDGCDVNIFAIFSSTQNGTWITDELELRRQCVIFAWWIGRKPVIA